MALVMLPCDLPWWTSVQRHLKHLLLASSCEKLISGMLKIHDMCNIGLDPDEDSKDPELLKGLQQYLEEEFTAPERQRFLDNTLRILVSRALQLRKWKPAKGVCFSLQQQSDITELEYNFVSSLLAHSFFSTFPKRTLKTHPTLQDFNFTHFFKNLHRKSQRCKLKSLMHYFEWIDQNDEQGSIKITRKVMTAKQWLTIEDWLECSLPLCRLVVKHEGRPERCEVEDAIRICFASPRLGGDVLVDGESQESLWMCMMPELLAALLSVEAIEDNEVVQVEGARLFTRISDRNKGGYDLEILDQPKPVTVVMMDAENYRQVPLSQWEEDNVLRELNKCLLAFQQTPSTTAGGREPRLERRLSPIGESNNSSPEVEATVMIKQTSCSTINSYNSRSPTPDAYCSATLNLNDPSIEITKRKCWLSPENNTFNNRRGRFIVLGSSGECLPVSRGSAIGSAGDGSSDVQEDSLYSSCNSSDDEYHSANDSFDEDSEDEGRGASGRPSCMQYSRAFSSEARRLSFAGRLRDALRREAEESCATSSTGSCTGCSTDSSSYAVGISISGANVNDNDIRVKRGGSVGFVLTEQEVATNGTTHTPRRKRPLGAKKDTGNSSKYSFSTEYSSELEEVYEQFNHWLEDPIVDAESGEHKPRELDARDMAVIRFAGSLLKRTLSESFAGMPLTDGCANTLGVDPADPASHTGERDRTDKHKLVLTARSLSLELAKHKHRLAAQLLSQLAQKMMMGGSCKPVVTGNWGCGRRQKGHPQLKLIMQWLAASVAGTPALIYYTTGNDKLFKLDTLVRVLVDRKWTVGQLTKAVVRFARQCLRDPSAIQDNHSLFDELIGIEKISDDL